MNPYLFFLIVVTFHTSLVMSYAKLTVTGSRHYWIPLVLEIILMSISTAIALYEAYKAVNK